MKKTLKIYFKTEMYLWWIKRVRFRDGNVKYEGAPFIGSLRGTCYFSSKLCEAVVFQLQLYVTLGHLGVVIFFNGFCFLKIIEVLISEYSKWKN